MSSESGISKKNSNEVGSLLFVALEGFYPSFSSGLLFFVLSIGFRDFLNQCWGLDLCFGFTQSTLLLLRL